VTFVSILPIWARPSFGGLPSSSVVSGQRNRTVKNWPSRRFQRCGCTNATNTIWFRKKASKSLTNTPVASWLTDPGSADCIR
tara:strand:+ start:39051 stop:39296 length:246 start_codon:yes stop_codon:yes gene_type:complete